MDDPQGVTAFNLADRILERLEPFFVFEREVPGKHCTGRRLILDAVLRPRDPATWKNPQVAFGVEFKYPEGNIDPSVSSYTGWAAQAIDYTHVEWDGYGRIFIFTCPGVSALGLHEGNVPMPGTSAFALSHLLGQLGVGELVLLAGYGLTFLLQTNHRVWSERSGVSVGRHWSLQPKCGSR